MLKLRLEVQKIFNKMAEGLVASVTGKTYDLIYSQSVSIDVSKNEYTFDFIMYSGEKENPDTFRVVINNDYMRVYNDDKEFDFTSITYYFSGCRVAIAKEDEKVVHS